MAKLGVLKEKLVPLHFGNPVFTKIKLFDFSLDQIDVFMFLCTWRRGSSEILV